MAIEHKGQSSFDDPHWVKRSHEFWLHQFQRQPGNRVVRQNYDLIRSHAERHGLVKRIGEGLHEAGYDAHCKKCKKYTDHEIVYPPKGSKYNFCLGVCQSCDHETKMPLTSSDYDYDESIEENILYYYHHGGLAPGASGYRSNSASDWADYLGDYPASELDELVGTELANEIRAILGV